MALAVATAAALLVSAAFIAPEFRITVYRALAGDLALPVVGWYVMKAIHRKRERKAQDDSTASTTDAR